jgi:anti-anti-sigma factor
MGRLLSHFRVEKVEEADAGVLRLHGELDVASSVVLEEELGKLEGADRLVLDLTPLDFIDSSGIGVLFKASQHAADRSQRFALIRGTGQVTDMLELTGLADRLVVVDSLEDLPES